MPRTTVRPYRNEGTARVRLAATGQPAERACRLEILEDRRLLSASGANENHVTTIPGTHVWVEPQIAHAPRLSSPPEPPAEHRHAADHHHAAEHEMLYPPLAHDPLGSNGDAPLTAVQPLPSDHGGSTLTGSALGGGASPDDFKVFQKTPLGGRATAGSLGEVVEPAVGSIDDLVFMTGDWFASISEDHGASFDYIDPTDLFPETGAFAGGFCCDQRVAQSSSRDMLFWYIQYGTTGDTPDDTNGVRIAAARSRHELINNLWTYYDFTPENLGLGANRRLDHASLEVSDNYLYATSGVWELSTFQFISAVMWRIPLDQIVQGGPVDVTVWPINPLSYVALTDGATSTMYAAATHTSTSLMVYTQHEADDLLVQTEVTGLNATYGTGRGSHTSIGADGSNWTARADERVQTGWITGNSVGFMWNSAQGPGRPQPFVRAAVLDTNTLQVLSQPDLWGSAAWHYPSLAVNARGHLAGVVATGSPISAPGVAALISDDVESGPPWTSYQLAAGTNGGKIHWGDYFGARADDDFPNTWIAAGYVLNGPSVGYGPISRNIQPFFFWIGRQRDQPTLPAQSQILVYGGGRIAIATGDGGPTAGDSTDFGNAGLGESVLRSFTIRNGGTADLQLTGSPRVIIGGPNAADFSIVTMPSATVPADGGATLLRIRFAPSDLGQRRATIAIPNNDPTRSPYTFTIQGTGIIAPQMVVFGNGRTIANGDLEPSIGDGTDFGRFPITQMHLANFYIDNIGAGLLQLDPIIKITGPHAGDFSVVTPPATQLTQWAYTPFMLRFTPGGTGPRTATVTIYSNDPDNSSYSFAIRALVVNLPNGFSPSSQIPTPAPATNPVASATNQPQTVSSLTAMNFAADGTLQSQSSSATSGLSSSLPSAQQLAQSGSNSADGGPTLGSPAFGYTGAQTSAIRYDKAQYEAMAAARDYWSRRSENSLATRTTLSARAADQVFARGFDVQFEVWRAALRPRLPGDE